jgi:hypothetical protein
MAKSTVVSLPPVPTDLLHWQDLTHQFDEWTLRRIHWLISEVQFDNLRHQVYVMAASLRNELQLPITDIELGVLFGHMRGWATRMITQHLQHLTDSARPSQKRSIRDRATTHWILSNSAKREKPCDAPGGDWFHGAKWYSNQSILDQSLRQAK